MDTDQILWIFALVGTALFVVRSILIFAGVGVAHGDVYHDVDSASGTEAGFKILSIHTVTAFAMTFGWAGLAAHQQLGFGTVVSVIIAFAVGVGAMFLAANLFRIIPALSSSGATYSLDKLVGTIVTVYERIPEKGTGRIQAHIGGMLREIEAISDTQESIDSMKKVQVSRVVDKTTVAVRPAA